MGLVKFNNGHGRSFNEVFESMFNDQFISERMASRTPAVNIAETDNEFQIEMAAPGLKKEDFKINLDKNILTISSEKKEEKKEEGKKYNKREFSYGSFTRAFTLPDSADYAKIDAAYTDGVLTVSIAKREEAKFQSRSITLK